MKALKLWSLTLEAKSSDDRSMECHLIKFDIISQILLKFLGGGGNKYANQSMVNVTSL